MEACREDCKSWAGAPVEEWLEWFAGSRTNYCTAHCYYLDLWDWDQLTLLSKGNDAAAGALVQTDRFELAAETFQEAENWEGGETYRQFCESVRQKCWFEQWNYPIWLN